MADNSRQNPEKWGKRELLPFGGRCISGGELLPSLMANLRKTALYEEHLKAGGRMVEFAGWEMPVQYTGLKQEHLATRENVGLFDVSHMGEIRVKGDNALNTLEWLTTNHVAKLQAGQAQYSLLPNETGGIVDDLIVYCLQPNEDYMLCVNAANKDKDLAWVIKHNQNADIVDESDHWGQLAVQGPKAMALLSVVFGSTIDELKSFCFGSFEFRGESCIVARTGYTGEDGCEVFVPNSQASALWQELMSQGQKYGVQPVGLGARDTLRLEMKYSLYGHEITDQTNPYAAGLGWVVKAGDKDFIGKTAILSQKEAGLSQKLVGFRMLDKAIPRQDYKVFSFDNEEIGIVTSGTMSPSLDCGIGIAYVNNALTNVGDEFLIEIRSRKLKAQVVKTPFVERG